MGRGRKRKKITIYASGDVVTVDKYRYDKWGVYGYRSTDFYSLVRPTVFDTLKPFRDRSLRKDPISVPDAFHGDLVKIYLKNSCYFHSILGMAVFQQYATTYGLDDKRANLLVITSFYQVMLRSELRLWSMNDRWCNQLMLELEISGYIQRVSVPNKLGRGRQGKRMGYCLTKLGENFVDGYEAYYDSHMARLMQNVSTNQRLSYYLKIKEQREKKLQEDLWNARYLTKQVEK